jgi:glutamine amidotransferase
MPEPNVAIVDSGGANIASLTNALDRLGVDNTLTSDAGTIRNASHVILPGVGAAADAMHKLAASDLCGVIAGLEQPVLGICLGMQLLAESSAEDGTGWSRVYQTEPHDLFAGIDDGSYFYFVHSFALPPGDHVVATAEHAADFAAALAYRNFFAAQFHPERSADAGAIFLRNFLKVAP